MSLSDASALLHQGAPVPSSAHARQSWRTYYLGYANIFCRVWAYFVDSIFITFIAIVIFSLLREIAPGLLEWLAFQGQDERFESVWVIVAAVYFVGLEATGVTPGKRMVRLRVLRENGEPMTFWASLLRNALRPVDLMFLGLVGILFVSTSDQWQRLGDRVARTIVVQLAPR
jgi:uncharacterized RDD family membrane protein YckC